MIEQLILQALLLALIPFSFALLLDISLGKPGAEQFDRKAIFFGYSLFLAKLRLKDGNKLKELEDQYLPNMNADDPTIRNVATLSYKQSVFETGREFFTWELGFGMCPYCTNIRLAILAGGIIAEFFSGHWLLIFLLPCFANMYLIFFNKFKN